MDGGMDKWMDGANNNVSVQQKLSTAYTVQKVDRSHIKLQCVYVCSATGHVLLLPCDQYFVFANSTFAAEKFLTILPCSPAFLPCSPALPEPLSHMLVPRKL